MNIFDQNLETLSKHYPSLAERVLSYPDKDNLVAFETKDGGLAYALKKDTGIEYLTDPVTPVTRIGNQLQANSSKLSDFTLPVMVIGTYPGDEILYLFDLCEKAPIPHAGQKLYVCIDSIACFCAFLQTMDAQRVIQSDRVKFFWHEEAEALANEFRQKPDLSYLFTLVSGALNGSVNKVMKPFISLVQERSAETQRLMSENEAYYDAISDEELAEVISNQFSVNSQVSGNGCLKSEGWQDAGEPFSSHNTELETRNSKLLNAPTDNRSLLTDNSSTRAPRLMTLTSSWSTVTQYGARDLCEAMESAGWQTRKLNVDGTPTAHYIAKQINEFKPDIFVFINHLRTECSTLFPKNMMFITWVQDTVPQINNHEAAAKWNSMATAKLTTEFTETQSNQENSSSSSLCDLSGEKSSSPSRKRDLIIGYVGQLKKYGYLEDRLVEMPMIVNPNIFKPRVLTEEQKAKYGCDVMFASRAGQPSYERIEEMLTEWNEGKNLNCPRNALTDLHNRLWDAYRDGETFCSYTAVETFALTVPSFAKWYSARTEEERDYLQQQIFWSLNDLIYRQAVIEWLDELASGQETKDDKQQTPFRQDEHDIHNTESPSGDINRNLSDPVNPVKISSSDNSKLETQNSEPRKRLRLHLYGDGWNRHPRFARYWKGVLGHGEELSIAFQCAQRCLHLNSMESGHQRLLEIIASGGHPLTRTSLPADSDSSLLHSALRVYAQDSSRWLEKLPEEECLFINAWLYPVIIRMLKNDPTQTNAQIAQTLHDDMIRKLWKHPDWTVSGWNSLVFHSRVDLEQMLSGPVADCDMNTAAQRLGSINGRYLAHAIVNILARYLLKKETANITSENPWQALIQYARLLSQPDISIDELLSAFHAIRHPHQQIILDTVKRLEEKGANEQIVLLLDKVSPENMPSRQLTTYANGLANSGRFDDTLEIIDLAYTKNPNLKDVHARIAWKHFWTQKDHAKVIEWMLLDDTANRLSPGQRLNFAQALSAQGDIATAEKHVETAYTADPNLKDGYARIGWQAYWDTKQYAKVFNLCKRDIQSRQISPGWLINAAKAAAGMGKMNQADELIEQAYADSSDIKNGYAQIGWQAFAPLSAFDRTLPWFERDFAQNRLNPTWLLNYAQALSACGDYDKANELVDQAYESDPTLNNGYARCSWMRYVMVSFEPEKALASFEKDKTLGKLVGQHKILHAIVMAAAGDFATALSMVKQTYDEHPECTDGFSLIGWYHFVVNHNGAEKALELFKRDREVGRLSHQTQLLEAAVHANIGNISEATDIVTNSYTTSRTVVGGYTLVGCLNYLSNHNISFTLEMLQKDRISGRIQNGFLKYIHASFLMKDGNIAKADELLKQTACSAISEQYAVCWLQRLGFQAPDIVDLITPELHQQFQKVLHFSRT
ncbi:MAG: hypothetical protein A2283_02020 [Lentisphaerae bacterium RIFOXYA12_FULL_48_11]|nr:MAG: hypothetical protein A2283_02020 [Lentisphaerae bacterium RIFOXYA12_FULL_48_11]